MQEKNLLNRTIPNICQEIDEVNFMNFNNIFNIFIKELRTYFNSTIAYVIIVVFLALIGWFYVNNIFLIDIATMRPMFDSIIPLTLIFIIPAITMRQFAEEQKTGTLEILLTKPVTDWEIVLGKFLSSLILVIIMILPTILYYITLASISNIDHGQVWGGYLGLVLLASAFISMGLFASTLTSNQIVAFIIGMLLVLFFYLLDKILIYFPGWAVSTIEYFGVDYHYSNLSRGVIDSRNIIYFFSITGFMLYLSVISLERRKW